MITRLAKKIAFQLSRDDPDADAEVLAYGYELILQRVIVVAVELIIAIPFGVFFLVALSETVYSLMRIYAGGVHASKRIACMLSSFFIVYGPAAIAVFFGQTLPFIIIPIVFVADLILLLLYAPADTEYMPITQPENIKRLKKQSIAILSVCTVAAVLLWDIQREFGVVLIVMPTLVSVFTHPLSYKIYGCKKSNKIFGG